MCSIFGSLEVIEQYTTASLIVSHSHLLDGITTFGSPHSAVSARF